jgi:hypothetical protein
VELKFISSIIPFFKSMNQTSNSCHIKLKTISKYQTKHTLRVVAAMPLRQRFAPKPPGNTAATPAVWSNGKV